MAQDSALSAPWCRSGELAFWHSRSAWSLVVVACWRQRLLKTKTVHIWLPDYFCNASLLPLREMGAHLIFYPVTMQMEPDLSFCQILAKRHPLDIFVLAHYFGQPTVAKAIPSFCKNHGAWLIEDAAHILQPRTDIGEIGDCVLYSPHKHLPIPDGAVLVLRPDGPSQLTQNIHAMNLLCEVRDELFASLGASNKAAVIWLLKRLTQKFGLRSRISVGIFKATGEASTASLQNPQMSIFSKSLLTPLLGQLAIIAVKRKDNAQTWGDIFAWVDPKVVPISCEEATPYLAGFTIENSESIKVLFERFRQAGLPIITWPDLPPEVLANPELHSAAITLRDSRFYFPVHQTLSRYWLLDCSKTILKIATKGWQIRNISHSAWDEYWRSCRQTNVLQSWEYGDAKNQADGWQTQRYFILDENHRPTALAQILTRAIPFIGGFARLNRGPLLLTDCSPRDEIQLKLYSLCVLLKVARRRCWWLLQVVPELPLTNSSLLGLRALGFRKLLTPAWASGRIYLQIFEQSLLMGLQGKWRNAMRKGEKLGVVVSHLKVNAEALTLLVQSYAELQRNREFDGLSEKLIRALAGQQGTQWQFNIFSAREGGGSEQESFIGLLVTIRSGDTAVYLIGACNEKGRQMQANSVLLWQAVLHAKKSGCSWFDIGGLNDATPRGVADFKKGLNATPYELVGEWRWFLMGSK